MSRKIKGFKPETLKKIVRDLKTRIEKHVAELKSGKRIKLVISAGNIKIGRCMNVSLAPIVTCKNCGKCKSFCYDVKACLQYENVREARAKNTALFLFDRIDFFNQLWDRMSRRRVNKFLRFHVSGEIMDIDHFALMVETARRFPDFKVWTYTKMYWIVNEYIRTHGGAKETALPANFSVMFSEWRGVPIVNPYGLPVFRCIDLEEGDEIPENMMQCPGCCDVCKAGNCGCVAGQSAYVFKH